MASDILQQLISSYSSVDARLLLLHLPRPNRRRGTLPIQISSWGGREITQVTHPDISAPDSLAGSPLSTPGSVNTT